MKQRLQDHLNTVIPNGELVASSLPQCEGILLYLLKADYPQTSLTGEQINNLMDAPPYWAFCWASGQVLAAQIMANPSLVKDKTLLDFGSGSGVVAIAAKKAGATRAIACDQDSYALMACELNAQLNGVQLEYADDYASAQDTEVITVADVFYDRDNLPLLGDMQQRFGQLWVSDSRLKGMPLPGLRIVDSVQSHTVPDLSESIEFNSVTVYRS